MFNCIKVPKYPVEEFAILKSIGGQINSLRNELLFLCTPQPLILPITSDASTLLNTVRTPLFHFSTARQRRLTVGTLNQPKRVQPDNYPRRRLAFLQSDPCCESLNFVLFSSILPFHFPATVAWSAARIAYHNSRWRPTTGADSMIPRMRKTSILRLPTCLKTKIAMTAQAGREIVAPIAARKLMKMKMMNPPQLDREELTMRMRKRKRTRRKKRNLAVATMTMTRTKKRMTKMRTMFNRYGLQI